MSGRPGPREHCPLFVSEVSHPCTVLLLVLSVSVHRSVGGHSFLASLPKTRAPPGMPDPVKLLDVPRQRKKPRKLDD